MLMQEAVLAIRRRQRLSLVYEGFERVVEPHAVGLSRAGNSVMRAYQVRGGSSSETEGWKLLRLDGIQSPQYLEENSLAPRPGYQKGDKGMIRIEAEL